MLMALTIPVQNPAYAYRIPYSAIDYVNSVEPSYGKMNKFLFQRVYKPSDGFVFVKDTRELTILYKDGPQGFDAQWEGPKIVEDSPLHIKVEAFVQRPENILSGFIKFQVTAWLYPTGLTPFSK